MPNNSNRRRVIAMSLLRIAILQMEIVPGDRRANYEKVEKTLDSNGSALTSPPR